MNRRSSRVMTTAAFVVLAAACPAVAIEMFTYFGDGSRIGLPSLEVPVQAYPGIPLRSDRIRARSRANQARRPAPVNDPSGRVAPDGGVAPPAIPGGGIRVRPMPAQTVPRGRSVWPTPPAPVTVPSAGARTAPAAPSPVTETVRQPAPEPLARPAEKPLPGLTRPLFPSRP